VVAFFCFCFVLFCLKFYFLFFCFFFPFSVSLLGAVEICSDFYFYILH